MKNTLWAILIAISVTFLLVITAIAIAANYLYKIYSPAGWIFVGSVVIVLTGLGFWLRFWILIQLPKKWQALAKEGKFLWLPEEKHWIPVEKAGRFDRGYTCLAGVVTIQKARPNRQDDEPYLIDVPDDEVFQGLELWLHRFFARQGYIWLGFDAGKDSTVRVGVLNIPKARMKEVAGVNEVNIVVEPIRALRLTFNRYVKVEGIELLDGFKATFLCMGIVTVTDPYLAWYGLGGKAYDALDTKTQKLVRSHAEEVTLRSMYTKGADNGENIIEAEIKEGDPLMPAAIGMKTSVDIQDWDDNAPPNFLELMGKVQQIEQETLIGLAELDKARQLALGQGQVFDAEAKAQVRRAELEVQKALANAREFEALKALAGDDVEALTHLVLHNQLGATYIEYLRTRALEKTAVTVLGGDAFNVVKPKPDTK